MRGVNLQTSKKLTNPHFFEDHPHDPHLLLPRNLLFPLEDGLVAQIAKGRLSKLFKGSTSSIEISEPESDSELDKLSVILKQPLHTCDVTAHETRDRAFFQRDRVFMSIYALLNGLRDVYTKK